MADVLSTDCPDQFPLEVRLDRLLTILRKYSADSPERPVRLDRSIRKLILDAQRWTANVARRSPEVGRDLETLESLRLWKITETPPKYAILGSGPIDLQDAIDDVVFLIQLVPPIHQDSRASRPAVSDPANESVDHRATLRVETVQPVLDSDAPSAPTRNGRSEAFSRNIRRYQELCHWTNAELAKEARLTTRQVTRHRGGKTIPRTDNLRAYATAFSRKLERRITEAMLVEPQST